MSPNRHSSLLLLARFSLSLLSLFGLANVPIQAQEHLIPAPPEFKILSPEPDSQLPTPLPWIDVRLRIPPGRSARLELRRIAKDGSADLRSSIVPAGSNPIVRYEVRGSTLPVGDYELFLFPGEENQQIVDSIRFEIVKSTLPQTFPIITTPRLGETYRTAVGESIEVKLGGIAGGSFWIMVCKEDGSWQSERVALEGAELYKFEFTMRLNPGCYTVRTLRANPDHFITQPTSETTFEILEDPSLEGRMPTPADVLQPAIPGPIYSQLTQEEIDQLPIRIDTSEPIDR